MRKALWIGDAVCESGFAKVTHNTVDHFQDWEVHILGLNYRGDPHPYRQDIYRADIYGEGFGLRRSAELVFKLGIDLVIIQNDPWNLPAYLRRLVSVPVMATLAVDGLNCRGRELNPLRLALFWTQFGMREAHRGGYVGNAAVVPLGVDLALYRPIDKAEARRAMGIPTHMHDGFIIGNVNRNQPRKRFDLSIAYFAEWVHKNRIDDAFLFLHVAPTGDTGYDCKQLAEYYGVQNRVLTSEPEPWYGTPEDRMPYLYNCFDVQINTGQGEGWGLTTMEGMACGIPQIVPDWSALGEWTVMPEYDGRTNVNAALMVPCTSTAATFNNINVIGGVADRRSFIDSLHQLYSQGEWRDELRKRGFALVQQPQYRWPAIGQAFEEAVNEAMEMSPVVAHPRMIETV